MVDNLGCILIKVTCSFRILPLLLMLQADPAHGKAGVSMVDINGDGKWIYMFVIQGSLPSEKG